MNGHGIKEKSKRGKVDNWVYGKVFQAMNINISRRVHFIKIQCGHGKSMPLNGKRSASLISSRKTDAEARISMQKAYWGAEHQEVERNVTG